MPRNGSGTSTVVNTFVIDTIADPDEVNANFTDVADQLTNSLPRDGQAGMNAPLPLQNGTAALPALTFTSDSDTGIFRKATNTVGITGDGVEIASFSPTGLDVVGDITLSGDITIDGDPVTGGAIYGNCRLTLSGGNLLLSRFNGRLLTINSVGESIPSAGITLAASGLTPSTLYYIYAYMNSGTMTLEASTTVPVADTTTGVQIKTGDATRSLVGMARPVTGPAWADTIGQRFVRSWYNRDKIRGASAFTADRSTSSASLVELNTEIRNEFLTWADENVQANFSGWGSTSAGGPAVLKIVLDANTADFARCGTGLSSSANMSIAGTNTPGLGYHYVTMYASTSAGSMTIFGTGTAPGLLNTTIV